MFTEASWKNFQNRIDATHGLEILIIPIVNLRLQLSAENMYFLCKEQINTNGLHWINRPVIVALQYRHGVPNHQKLDVLFKRLLWLTTKNYERGRKAWCIKRFHSITSSSINSHGIHNSCQIVLKFCPEYGGDTVALWAKTQNDCKHTRDMSSTNDISRVRWVSNNIFVLHITRAPCPLEVTGHFLRTILRHLWYQITKRLGSFGAVIFLRTAWHFQRH